MPFEDSLSLDDPVFVGDRMVIEYEVFRRGEDRDNAHAVMEDVSSWTFSWALRKAVKRVDVYRAVGPAVISKSTSGGGIVVVGAFNTDRALNMQRVRVTCTTTETAPLVGATYVHGLKRADAGFEDTNGFGTIPVFALVAA